MDEKSPLPSNTAPLIARDFHPSGGNLGRLRGRRNIRRSRGVKFFVLACLCLIVLAQWKQIWRSDRRAAKLSVEKLNHDLQVCKKLRHKPRDPHGLGRNKNARYIEGARPTLIKNATIWVGEPVEGTSDADARAGKGWEWTQGDVFLEHGLIKKVEQAISSSSLPDDTLIFDAGGRLLTTGIIDMHSHAGLDSLPNLGGNEDINEFADNISPYVRSIDGLNVFDPQIQVIKSGGVTSSLILPGSSNNIGGEAYLVKLAVGREDGRQEISANDMLADPERHWRYMKMACGENPKSDFGFATKHHYASRLGESYAFRRAFEQARSLNQKQDDWCNKAEAVGLENMDQYLPQELRWETLGAALRGQVHVNVHCYTVTDLEAMVDHSNEFQFPIRTFHHAHQSFLVPEILNRTWGGRAPASALFADNMYYKPEAYIGSEYAGKILYEAGLTPVYVSDNPVINAQHVLFEAAKAYHYGLPYHAALASVTSAPAEELGMGSRLGKVKPGYDADVVVWDSDPLSVGATPVQVWIDGTAQFAAPFHHDKPVEKPSDPHAALAEVVVDPTEVTDALFTGIKKVLMSNGDAEDDVTTGSVNVVVSKGRISCVGTCKSEFEAATRDGAKVVEVKDGYLSHSFTGVAGTLGLNAIDAEDMTDNGSNDEKFTRAVDGLMLDNKKLHAAARYGVTRAITAPRFNGPGTHCGTSVGFVTTAQTSMGEGSVFASDAAVHYTLGAGVRYASQSYTQAFGALRSKLLDAVAEADKEPRPYSEAAYLKKVVSGELVLALTINSADGIASALRVKADVEGALKTGKIRMAIIGGAESYLVARELAAASVGVILTPLQPLPSSWESRRALSGAPLTNGTAADWLVKAGVTVGIGLPQDWMVRDLGFEAGTAYRNGGGRFTEKSAMDMVSNNIYEILGVDATEEESRGHFIVSQGSPLSVGSRIRAVGSGRGTVSLYV